MRIALAQTEIAWEDKIENFKKAKYTILEAKNEGADIVLFPEMSFVGFSMNTEFTKDKHNETYDFIRGLSGSMGIAVGYGWVKKKDELAENHYSVMDKNAKLIADYVKIHPFSHSEEHRFFKGGDKLCLFEMGGICFSVFICYDLRFPEIFQIASTHSEVIIVAANWPSSRKEHWKALLKARAIENQVYIVAVNCVGRVGGLVYSGDSCIINPDGEVLIHSNREELLIADVFDDVREYRDLFPIKKDRREELYYTLSGVRL